MAILANTDRQEVWADLMRRAGVVGLTKTQFRAAVDAIDTWIDSNTVSFNLAIPQPARAALTALQKSQILAIIALKRNEKGV